jgi:hypothetical protein
MAALFKAQPPDQNMGSRKDDNQITLRSALTCPKATMPLDKGGRSGMQATDGTIPRAIKRGVHCQGEVMELGNTAIRAWLGRAEVARAWI